MAKVLALGAMVTLTLMGCEPCAVVLSGHCTDAQHDEDTARDHGAAPGEQILSPPAPFYVPHSRG